LLSGYLRDAGRHNDRAGEFHERGRPFDVSIAIADPTMTCRVADRPRRTTTR
jgi:hypothetical protein